jgi:hypothetical protein
MRAIKVFTMLSVSLAALSLAFPGVAGAAADNVKDVFIRNTAAEPVPTRAVGTTPVNVTGTPTVNARQDGTYKVDVNGTPTVRIANTEAIPVTGTLATTQPRLMSHTGGGVEESQTIVGETYEVPQGKDLVVTYMGLETTSFAANHETTRLGVTDGTGTFGMGMSFPFERDEDGDARIAQPVQMVFPNRLIPYAQQKTEGELFRFFFVWTGYLVDEPAN